MKRLPQRRPLTGFLLLLILMLAPLARPAETDAASRQLYSANGLFNRGLYELAADEYLAFLKKDPDHPKADQARYALGLQFPLQEPNFTVTLDPANPKSRRDLQSGQCRIQKAVIRRPRNSARANVPRVASVESCL